jgi:protein-L-isoaspartate(D-aspartate) O-methyltransferase
MVDRQIRSRGIKDPRLLQALKSIPRHLFVPPEYAGEAYEDHPVDIGLAQTVSQPYMVAWMTEALELRGSERVLEVGTGSGYQTAVLARLAVEVYTIERLPALAGRAQEILDRLGFRNIHFRIGDGTLGLPDAAPFDGILVAAGGPAVPQALKDQLANGGRLVMPVGSRGSQDLMLLARRGAAITEKSLGGCVFVRLIGEQGWPES